MNSIRNMFFATLVLAGLVLAPAFRAWAQCHPSPNFSTMDRDFLEYLKAASDEGQRIAIAPFHDNHSGLPDTAIYSGLPFYIYDTFSPTHKGLLHPHVSVAAANSLGLSGDALTNPTNIDKLANALKARFVIFGSFQLTFRQTIMVHLNVFDAKSKSTLSPVEAFEHPLNDALFDLINTHVIKALSRIKGGPKLRASNLVHPSIESFRPYGQGMALAGQYNLPQLEQAEIWLERALKLSFHNYSAAALSLARVQFMKALIQKLSKMDYAFNFNRARETLQFVKSDVPANSFLRLLTYRYIEAQEASKQSLTALVSKQATLSVKHAETGLELVPEDGMLQNLYLGQTKGQLKSGFKLENPVCY